MNETPVSGPITNSNSHQDREAKSSRHSFRISQRNGLGERKEHLFEIRDSSLGTVARGDHRGQVFERALAADIPSAEQHEPVAEPRRVADLMDREEHRSAAP